MFKSLAKSHHFPEIITTCEIHAAWFYFQSWKQKKSPPKKQKIKNCRHRKKKRKSFSRTVTGRALPRSASVAPLRRRLLDRGLLLEALRLRQRGRDQSHRRATNGARSHRTIAADSLGPIAHSAAHHFHPRWLTLSIIFYRRWDSCISCI